jgi:hypothetical protein
MQPRAIGKLFWSTLLSLPLMPLNPLGLEVFTVPLDTVGIGGLRKSIQEWQSPDFSQPQTWGFILLSLLLVGAFLASRRRPDATEWILIIGALCLALQSGRHLSLFALIAVPVATIHFDQALSRRGWTIARRQREKPRRVIINLMLIALVALGTMMHLAYVAGEKTIEKALLLNFPVNAVRHLKASPLEGNLFNSYNWGGYLIFAAPGYPVFIDGRTDLHRGLLADYLAARGTGAWQQIFDRWDIHIAILESPSQLAAQLQSSSSWRREYADAVASIFVRTRQ